MAACLMIMYIVIWLEKCVLQMAKQPVKCIIICCSSFLCCCQRSFNSLNPTA